MLMRHQIQSRRLHQNGDTIVEVLIAIVVVSAVLTGAFSIANLSLKSIRMAQERGEAQKIAQRSVEQLNSFRPPDIGVTAQGAEFCIESSAAVPSAIAFDPARCASGTDDRYKTTITRTGSGPVLPVFKIRVYWDGIKGGEEQVEFYYQARKPS